MRFLLVVPLGGCFAQVAVDRDPDGDGLDDAAEVVNGTDRAVPDSDGDAWLDGDEVHGNTDPLDSLDHPYTGGWEIDACRDDIDPTGYDPGEVAHDFALADQFGDAVSLHSFCGKVVYVEFSGFA